MEDTQMVSYVTYDSDGNLDGSYLQDVHEEHIGHMIVVDEETRSNWVNYRANAARDGVELIPASETVAQVIVPSQVTRRQARQALAIKGFLAQVVPAINSLDDGTTAGALNKELALIEWEDSLAFERHRPLVISLGTALGLSSTDLDSLFIFAATL